MLHVPLPDDTLTAKVKALAIQHAPTFPLEDADGLVPLETIMQTHEHAVSQAIREGGPGSALWKDVERIETYAEQAHLQQYVPGENEGWRLVGSSEGIIDMASVYAKSDRTLAKQFMASMAGKDLAACMEYLNLDTTLLSSGIIDQALNMVSENSPIFQAFYDYAVTRFNQVPEKPMLGACWKLSPPTQTLDIRGGTDGKINRSPGSLLTV